MVARTGHKALAKPSIVIDEADPQSWLYLNPTGPSPSGIVFGVLRREYAGRVNTASEFGWHKCHPVAPVDGEKLKTWRPTAERTEVLLPAGVDDVFADPAELLRLMDACALPREKALLVYLTLPLGDVDRIHVGWERARSFIRERFVCDRGLASILALHAPGRIGCSNPLHAHALISPRAGKLGMAHGSYDEQLIHDGGQSIVEAMWVDHLAAFR